MNLKIEKRHNELIKITVDDNTPVVKGLIIEAHVHEEDKLKVILTYSSGVIKSLNNKIDNIVLDMDFGGGYELKTYGQEDDLNKRIMFKYGEMLLGRIQWFRYEINTAVSYGKMEMEITLT